MTAISREVGFSRVELTLPALSLTDDDYTISLADINPSEGATIKQRITCDGSSKVLFTGPNFTFVKDDSSKLEIRSDVTAGAYQLDMKCVANDVIEVSFSSVAVNASVAPTMDSIVINAANDEITITFNEETYNAIEKAGNLVAADFTPTLTSGTATTPVLSNPVHTAGDLDITFDLAYTGTADGDEVLKVIPVVDSVYNRGSVVMPITESVSILLNVV